MWGMKSFPENQWVRYLPLVLASGFCALIYQIAWQREFRLIFGASTAANAAVVAIFIGGLGLGGLVLGRYADRSSRPLALYAWLEALVAVTAAATPVLLWLIHRIYIAAGGTAALGMAGGTLLRLLLAVLVLGLPTLLMGGTLPAIVRSAETDADTGRRRLAMLYGANTLGAVAGAMFSTFFLLEILGTHRTLWVACLLNLLVAVVARHLARHVPDIQSRGCPGATEDLALTGDPSASAGLTLIASATVGFVFFLMEIVWYRMLSPLLGGSVFTFGLILAIALLGIGAGGMAYALLRQNRPATMRGFALTCVCEALCLAIPFALGDRIALFTVALRQLSIFGFPGRVLIWSTVCAIVVLPAAVVSGVQFPLLIALLGRGRSQVGRQVGLAYAFNTVGAIAGAVAGGFGLLPTLGAVNCWKLTVVLLLVLGLIALASSLRRERRPLAAVAAAAVAVCALVMLGAQGPTAAWRHSSIGAGRESFDSLSYNRLRAFLHRKRSGFLWEREGIESSVALSRDGLPFFVNGKSDSHPKMEAGTVVMAGVLGAILRPQAEHALVIGLGTGGTAGWLAAVTNVKRVDVAEIEPAIVDVARACHSTNEDVLNNPKVHITIGDAREILLTSRDKYDIISSEPSNPFRAGIASLFTKEYYEAAKSRLRDNGVFVQWVQAYEIDALTMRTIYASMGSVFPYVETWQTMAQDLVLVGSRTPTSYDAAKLRSRIAEPTIRRALLAGWQTKTLEGVLAHYAAGPRLPQAICSTGREAVNTDDHTLIEFGFARAVGTEAGVQIEALRQVARAFPDHRPAVQGNVDWDLVGDEQAVVGGGLLFAAKPGNLSPDAAKRWDARIALLRRDLSQALKDWRAQPQPPRTLSDKLLLCEAYAQTQDPETESCIERLRPDLPFEADVLQAMLRYGQGRTDESAGLLEFAFATLSRDPWPVNLLITDAMDLACTIVERQPELAPRLYNCVKRPFCGYTADAMRVNTVLRLAPHIDPVVASREIWHALEPNVPWDLTLLSARSKCYKAAWDPYVAKADADLEEFTLHEALPLELTFSDLLPQR